MLKKFLKEMATVFPSENIHLGHDEVNRNCYLDDPKFKALIEAGSDLNTLLQIFQDKIQSISKSVQKVPIFWEDVLLDFPTNVPKHSLIQIWKGPDSARLVLDKGYHIIVSDSKSWYLDCNIFISKFTGGHGNWVNGNKSWCDPFHTWANM